VIRVVLGTLTESTMEALLRETRPDGAVVSPSGKALLARLGDAAHLLDLDDAPIGSAWLSPAGPLHASFLIHLVVQGRDEPVSPESVRLALTNGLRRAAAFGIESVALPPLGVGAGNLDHEQAARIVVEVIAAHLEQGRPPAVFEVVVQSEYEEDVFRRVAARYLPEYGPD
jgi:O-acetyl-ADP-ribose deacetylase (regulator of RNase III)